MAALSAVALAQAVLGFAVGRAMGASYSGSCALGVLSHRRIPAEDKRA